MITLFVSILNMSLTASYVAVAVILARVLLRRAPTIFSYLLWSAVMIRLVMPVSFTSGFSILGLLQPVGQDGTGAMEFVPHNIGMQLLPAVDTGISSAGSFMNSFLPSAAPEASANPMQFILWAGSIIWLTGAAALLLLSVISYLRILRRVRTATLVVDNIFETDQISTPFVCGFMKPRIYLPVGIGAHELSYIILHEQTHISRRDYLIKPLMYLLVIIHWFNPLMWLSYALMSKDIEMSCDETVVKKLGPQIKASYSGSLLALSVRRSGGFTGSPLAFGDSSVKARIKNILAYRQPHSGMVAGSVLVLALLIIGCTANPKPVQNSPQSLYSGYAVDQLMESKTNFVGDNSKVVALIGEMPLPAGLEGAGIELKTGSRPYELTINYSMKDAAGVMKDGAISGEVFFRNSILLFSLIDNVDSIIHVIADHTGEYDGVTYTYTFLREQIDKQLGEDVRQYAADETGLRQLIGRLDSVDASEPANRDN
ncbi:peptidase M56 BlaR1 [Paenibacillus sp. IHB B 3415]|uniref:M56 family metallopeptidase n=1 Tax=Paenibacillus sp. IHB B 3415 TaxID=867080 RepID=UPI0005753B1C|nr:M56 family metallopeptidase [Paenibacillus sp. IHB B 3415]KHL95524.1 peptidase M56 BlaR1 [Paenibacillus sp. IHB B 3415]